MGNGCWGGWEYELMGDSWEIEWTLWRLKKNENTWREKTRETERMGGWAWVECGLIVVWGDFVKIEEKWKLLERKIKRSGENGVLSVGWVWIDSELIVDWWGMGVDGGESMCWWAIHSWLSGLCEKWKLLERKNKRNGENGVLSVSWVLVECGLIVNW